MISWFTNICQDTYFLFLLLYDIKTWTYDLAYQLGLELSMLTWYLWLMMTDAIHNGIIPYQSFFIVLSYSMIAPWSLYATGSYI